MNARTPRIKIQTYIATGFPPGRNRTARIEMNTSGVVSKRLRRRKRDRTAVDAKRRSFTKIRAFEKKSGSVKETMRNQQRKTSRGDS
jgi:hypothetical protein